MILLLQLQCPLLYPLLPQFSSHFEHQFSNARFLPFPPPNISLLLKWKLFPLHLPYPQLLSLLHLPSHAHSRNNSPWNCGNAPPPIILKLFKCVCHKCSLFKFSFITFWQVKRSVKCITHKMYNILYVIQISCYTLSSYSLDLFCRRIAVAAPQYSSWHKKPQKLISYK